MKIFKERNFKTLFFHYFKKFFIISLLFVVLLLVFLYYIFFETTYKEMRNNEVQLHKQTAQILENVTSECDRSYNAIITNNNFSRFLYTNINSLTKKELYDLLTNTKNLLSSNQLTSSYIKDIIVVSKKNNITISANNFFSDFINSEWYNEFVNSKNNVFTTVIKTKDINESFVEEYILLCRNVGTSYNEGQIFFVIDSKSVKDSIYSFISHDNIFYLFNQDIILHSDSILNDISIDKLNLIYQGKEKNSDFNIYSNEIGTYSYKMVLMMNNSAYTNLAIKAFFIFFIVIILSLILIYFISYTLTKNTMRPISEIMKIIENPKYTDYNLKTGNTPEMQFITKNILNSFENKTFYKEQFEKKLDELNEAQEIALRTQIQPHFLFNTLETIRAVSFESTKGDNMASQMLKMLSELLKVSFRNDNKFITIKEEIHHLKNYLGIQKIRYYDLFEIKWDIDDNCLEYSTLKLILQPIVENAIYHGIKKSDHFCYIKISIKESENNEYIVFTIENNGKKIETQMLENLTQMLKGEVIPSKSHIGLNNVNTRIKLAFGEKYGCEITSTDTKTTVKTTIPKTKIVIE